MPTKNRVKDELSEALIGCLGRVGGGHSLGVVLEVLPFSSADSKQRKDLSCSTDNLPPFNGYRSY